MEFQFDYLKCEKCGKKDLCDSCEGNLTEDLLLEPEIRCVNFRMQEKVLSVSSELELRKLEELLRKYDVIVH